jgi:hypothetical protein
VRTSQPAAGADSHWTAVALTKPMAAPPRANQPSLTPWMVSPSPP